MNKRSTDLKSKKKLSQPENNKEFLQNLGGKKRGNEHQKGMLRRLEIQGEVSLSKGTPGENNNSMHDSQRPGQEQGAGLLWPFSGTEGRFFYIKWGKIFFRLTRSWYWLGGRGGM